MSDASNPLFYLRAVLCLIVALGYLGATFFGARRVTLPRIVHISGTVFFLAAAIKNVGLAFGAYGSDWFILNELVQAVAIVVFIASLVRLLAVVNHFRSQRDAERGTPPAEVE